MPSKLTEPELYWQNPKISFLFGFIIFFGMLTSIVLFKTGTTIDHNQSLSKKKKVGIESFGLEANDGFIPKDDIEDTISLFVDLRDELDQRRYKKDCYSSNDKYALDILKIDKAKNILSNINPLGKERIEKIFIYVLYYIIKSPVGTASLMVGIQLENGDYLRINTMEDLKKYYEEGSVLITTLSQNNGNKFCYTMKLIRDFDVIVILLIVIIAGVSVVPLIFWPTSKKARYLRNNNDSSLNDLLDDQTKPRQ